jgi:hypothetical protein
MQTTALLAVLAGITCLTLISLAHGRGQNAAPQRGDATIPGYSLGRPDLMRSPVSLEDLAQLEEVLLFGEEDRAALRRSRALLEPRVDEILDVWYGFVGSKPQLLASFSHPETGAPDAAYLDAVRLRFGQWILDTADARHDQAWLDHSHELGRRHHTSAKNRTDGAEAAAIVPLRYLLALNYPISATLRPFLEGEGISAEETERMHRAWIKSVLLQTILWSEPYTQQGTF